MKRPFEDSRQHDWADDCDVDHLRAWTSAQNASWQRQTHTSFVRHGGGAAFAPLPPAISTGTSRDPLLDVVEAIQRTTEQPVSSCLVLLHANRSTDFNLQLPDRDTTAVGGQVVAMLRVNQPTNNARR